MKDPPSGTVGAEQEVGPAPMASGEGDGSVPGRKEVSGDAERWERDGDLRAGSCEALERGSASRLHKVRPRFQFIQFNTCETRYISF